MISVVIPNYNGENNLKKNLALLIEELYSQKDAEIIVVDDASTDSSILILEQIISENKETKIKLIRNEKNRGFSPTVNKGVSKASGELVVLLNTDVYPKKNFLAAPVSDMELLDVFAVGFMDESHEDGKVVMRGRGVGEWKRGFLIHKAGSLEKKDNLWASGGSSLFKKEIWDKLGGLDEIYAPFYWEDIDISYRALRSGYRVLFEKNSVVVHEHEEGSIKKSYSSKKVKEVAYRNQFIFVWKNASLPLLLSNILWIPYHVSKALVGGDLPFFAGFLQALLLAPRILKKRRKTQSMFTKSDLEVQIKE